SARAATPPGAQGPRFRTRDPETLDALLDRLAPAFFDPDVDRMVTCKTPPPEHDILTASCNNLYEGVSLADVHDVAQPVSPAQRAERSPEGQRDTFRERHPLNSRLLKQDGRL